MSGRIGPSPPYLEKVSDLPISSLPPYSATEAPVSVSEESTSSLPRTPFPERPRAYQTSDTFGPPIGPFLYIIMYLLVAIVVFVAVYLINGARL